MLKFMMQASPEFEGYESKDTIGTPTIDRDIVYSLNIFLFFLGGGARGGGVIELIYMYIYRGMTISRCTKYSNGDCLFFEELQHEMASLFGKEDALFVPSGTMGNLLSGFKSLH